MANNRLYIRCKACKESMMVTKCFGGPYQLPDSCTDCEFLRNGFTEEAPMWECGLESDEMTSVLVDDHGKPFDFRPMWCRYGKEAE